MPFEGEKKDEFDSLESSLLADWKPQTVVEQLLVGRILGLCWRLIRFEMAENPLFATIETEMPIKMVKSLSQEERAFLSKGFEELQQRDAPEEPHDYEWIIRKLAGQGIWNENSIEKSLEPTIEKTVRQKISAMRQPGSVVLKALSLPDQPVSFVELDRLRRAAERDLVRTRTMLIALQDRREGFSSTKLLTMADR